MLNKYRYILSKCKERVFAYYSNNVQYKNSYEQLIAIVNVKYALGDKVNIPLAKRCKMRINTTTINVTPQLLLLKEVLDKATAKTNKYIETPTWFTNQVQTFNYDYFMEVNNNFITEQQLIAELYVKLTAIDNQLEQTHNVKFKDYYQTKVSKLYKELISIINQFN